MGPGLHRAGVTNPETRGVYPRPSFPTLRLPRLPWAWREKEGSFSEGTGRRGGMTSLVPPFLSALG